MRSISNVFLFHYDERKEDVFNIMVTLLCSSFLFFFNEIFLYVSFDLHNKRIKKPSRIYYKPFKIQRRRGQA